MSTPSNSDDPTFAFPVRKERIVSPLAQDANTQDPNPAIVMLRQKIDLLYENEPNAKAEIQEAEAVTSPRSKHQQFMHELSGSGKSLADIQTAWHNYYVSLPDSEKHIVWQEFYTNYDKAKPPAKSTHTLHAPTPNPFNSPKVTYVAPQEVSKQPPKKSLRTVSEIKHQLLGTVSTRVIKQQKKASHLHSLAFGLGMGLLVLVFLMFGFFNERFIAPFITPSKNVSATPIIIDPSNTPVGPESKIIIPKINVEAPVVYDEPSIEEGAVQKALERGILHYATTVNPGEIGNSVLFGHSSNNILNRGKYKFAFILLKALENGDTFIIQKDGKRYVYRVFEKKIVAPSDVSVLSNSTKPSTMTLITCDPPGLSTNRLVVIGEQISPEPSSNVASTTTTTPETPKKLPSDAPPLWQRIFNSGRD